MSDFAHVPGHIVRLVVTEKSERYLCECGWESEATSDQLGPQAAFHRAEAHLLIKEFERACQEREDARNAGTSRLKPASSKPRASSTRTRKDMPATVSS